MAKCGGNLIRNLGCLETMYHIYHKHDIGIYTHLVRLRCAESVKNSQVRKAMEYLHLQHPVLRMLIRETKESAHFQFVEMNPLKIECRVSSLPTEELLREEIDTKFDPNGPLWRITIQRYNNTVDNNENISVGCHKENHKFPHKFSFVLTCHHSLVDGIYIFYLLGDFMELLDKIQKNQIRPNDIQQRDLPSPSEQYMQTIHLTEESVIIPSLSNKVTSLQALAAYEQCFHNEINRLRSNPVQGNAVEARMVRQETQQFLSDCKLQGVLVSGAIAAASCYAFAKQVESAFSSEVEVLEIPIEIMVDMRRYISSVQDFATYPGAAVIHVPFLVKVPIREKFNSEEMFWQIAKKISDDINHAIHSTNLIQFMKDEVKRTIESPAEKGVGKSSYVLIISNLNSVDHLVKPGLRPRFYLEGFPGLTLIDIDHHPIFELHVFSLSGQFHFNIWYCGRYTSKETAARFSSEMTQIIQNNRGL